MNVLSHLLKVLSRNGIPQIARSETRDGYRKDISFCICLFEVQIINGKREHMMGGMRTAKRVIIIQREKSDP